MESQNASQLYPRDIRWIVITLAVLFVCAPLFPQRTSHGYSFLFQSMLYLFMAFVVLRIGWHAVLSFLCAVPLFFPGVTILAFYALSLFYAPDPYTAKAKLALLLAVFLLYCVSCLVTIDKSQRMALLLAFAVSGCFAALYALYRQWAGHGELIESLQTFHLYSDEMRNEMIRTLEANRAIGHFGNPNHLAGFLVLSLWPLWLLLKESRCLWRGGLLSVMAVLILFAIYQTFSRSGLLVLLCTVLLFFLYELLAREKWRWLCRTFWIGLLLAIIGVPLFLMAAPGDFLGGRLLTTSTIVARLHFFRGGLLIMREHPVLGTGPESFATSYCEHIRPADLEAKYVHNLFLEAGVEGGIVGVILLMWLLIAVPKFLLQRWWVDHQNRLLIFAGLGSLIGLLLFSLIDFHNNLIEMYLVPVFLLGQIRPGFPNKPFQIQWIRLLGYSLGILLFVTWILLVFCRYYNKTEGETAYALFLENKLGQAKVLYERALFFDHTDSDSWIGLARIWQKNPPLSAQQKALDCFGRAVKFSPRRASHRADYADALFRLGYHQEAIQQMHRAQDLFPSRPAYHEQLGGMLDALGRKDEARAWLEKARKLKTSKEENTI
jgi:O-antigen ligase